MNFSGELKKYTWKTARKLVKSVYPELAEIIDELSPDDRLALYVAKYSYGTMIVDNGVFFIPNSDGRIVPLQHSTIPESYKKDLDFDGTIPVGLVMKNSIESFMLQGKRITPFTLFRVGDMLALWRIFDKGKSYQEAPFWKISSGSRAICMLPKITDQSGYRLLKKKYNLSSPIPKNLGDHWPIFSYLANHPEFSEPWSSEIIYFSKEWFAHREDSQWSRFYHFLLHKVWQESGFTRNKMMFDYFFSIIQEKRNLKPSPYLADTFSHLMAICSGEASGFIPARDNTAAPIGGLQKVFIEDYRLKKYPPVIMHTHHFSLEKKIPVYYSFEIPTTMQFSPKSNSALTTMAEIREIKHITETLLEEIQAGNLGIERTPLFSVAKNLKISFYHNEKDATQEVSSARNLALLDKSLTQVIINNKQYTFPESSPFFRGCITVAHVGSKE
jgi:hypothetical protein